MIYQTLKLFSFMTLVIVACGAPTPLDAATLLQNGEEAQALNRFFLGLKASDPCKDGQVACLIGKTIATCRGTAWETTVDSCSKSQRCFALPSVSSSGTRLSCTSEKSAENLISATGATGGIFGNPNNSTIKVYNGDTTGTDEPSTTQVMNTNTPAHATAAATGVSGSKPDNSPANNADGSDGAAAASHHPCTKAGAMSSQATPTPIANPNLPSDTPSVSATNSPAAANTVPQRVTVTVTLIPSQATTLAPQTRTISPEDASLIIASIQATGGPTVTPKAPSYNTPAPAPTSTQAAADDAQISSTLVAVASPSPSPAAQGSDSGYY